MCRLMVYLGTPCLLADLVTKPSRSLTRQSYDAKERLTGHGYLNGDGFGIGWYLPKEQQKDDPTPCVFSSIQPAWNNRNLERLANKIRSPLIFAHVRAAYPGIPVNDSNCQPFVCGRYMWMHNGGVGGFHRVRRKLLDSLNDDVYQQCPSFESDSAICFALFLNHIEDPMQQLGPAELASKMEATINDVTRLCEEAGVSHELSLLNFVVSDGHTVVATRFCNLEHEECASLYYACGSSFDCVDGDSNEYLVRHADRRGSLGIVASEPLTNESADWIKVPRNTMVVMTRFKAEFVDLLLVPINATPAVTRDVSRAFKSLASCKSSSLRVSLSLSQAHSQAHMQSRGRSQANGAWLNGTAEQVEGKGEGGEAAGQRKRGSSGAVGGGGGVSEEDSAGNSWDWRNRGGNINGLVAPPRNIPIISAPRHAMTSKQRQPVLALAVDGSRVFAGSQDGLISVYDLASFQSVCQIAGHSQTIFALTVKSDLHSHTRALYSSSTRVVKIWDTRSFRLLSTLRYSDGDVFSLALALGRSVAGPAGTSIIRCIKASSSARGGAKGRGAGAGGGAGTVPRPSSLGTISERIDMDGDHEDSMRSGARGMAGVGSQSMSKAGLASLSGVAAVGAGHEAGALQEGEDGRSIRFAGMQAMHSLPHMVLTPDNSTGDLAERVAGSLAASNSNSSSSNSGSNSNSSTRNSSSYIVPLTGSFSLSNGSECAPVGAPAVAAMADAGVASEMNSGGRSVWEPLSNEVEAGGSGEEEESRAAAAAVASVAAALQSSAPISIPARPRADLRTSGAGAASSLEHELVHGSPSVGCCSGRAASMSGREAVRGNVSDGVDRGTGGLSHEVRMNGGGSTGEHLTHHPPHAHTHGGRECSHSQSISPEPHHLEDSYLMSGLGCENGSEGEEGSLAGQRDRIRGAGKGHSYADARNGGAAQPEPNVPVSAVAQLSLPAARGSTAVGKTPATTFMTSSLLSGGSGSATAACPSSSAAPSSSSSSAAATAAAAVGTAGAGVGMGVGVALCRSSEAALSLTDTDKGGHCSRVYALVVCDQELLCSGAGDTFVKVWSLSSGECVATLHGHKGGVMALALAPAHASATAAAPAPTSHSQSETRDSRANGTNESDTWNGTPGKKPSKQGWRLLSGSRDNTVRVWDLSSLLCITTLTGHTDDVVALATGSRNELYSASSDHTIRMWSLLSYDCLCLFLQEGSSFLSLACTPTGVVSGSSDGVVRYWEVSEEVLRDLASEAPAMMGMREEGLATADANGSPSASGEQHLEAPSLSQLWRPKSPSFKLQNASAAVEAQLMEDTLRRLLRMRTVSSDCSHSTQEQMWRASTLIMSLLEDMGAEAKLVVAVDSTSPVVFGRIIKDPSLLTVTICGHYDVSDAGDVSSWQCDPFDLTALDGFLLGRGVSSSKGPLVAVLCAVKELVCSGQLAVNIVFIIDGVQEHGWRGYKEAVHSNLDWFEGTGLILASDGAWISDHHPCLTYGMRGLICLVVEMRGPLKDLHSGTHGGTFSEPLNDLVTVLSNLVDSNGMILIPGFYDDVKSMDEREEELYRGLHFPLEDYKARTGLSALTAQSSREVLQASWRHPSLSIVGVSASSSSSCASSSTSTSDANTPVAATASWSSIPKAYQARIAIRHVPDQDPARLVSLFRSHVAHEYAKLRSRGNSVDVRVDHVGDWWLADPSCSFYRLAGQCIHKHWGRPPMYIREGGTMPVVPFLETTLGAPAIKIPISQATDYSALQNEKLRWTHLMKGKDVIRDFILALGQDL